MNQADIQYLNLCQYILDNGEERDDRTGTGTLAVFSPPEMRFDLNKGFPLLTTKRVFWKGVAHELVWFLDGDTNIKYLNDNGVHIWDEWADEEGELGSIYGAQWRKAYYLDYHQASDPVEYAQQQYDQIAEVIKSLKENPTSRRHVVSTWQITHNTWCALHPCHGIAIQFYVTNKGKLNCFMYQRSADVFLGLPFNIASYALLTYIIADCTGYKVGELIIKTGDTHIYKNHIDQIKEQLTRTPKELPELLLKTKHEWPWEYSFNDFHLIGYDPHPAIKGDVSV